MELHKGSPHFKWQALFWPAAAISGIAAGIVFAALALTAVWSAGGSFWGPLRVVAAIAMGIDVFVQPTAYNLAMTFMALSVHFMLSVGFALILAAIIFAFNFDSSVGIALAVGGVFGVLVYLPKR
ncbi:hypothetical protein [Caballeronia sordidicola]|uniref:Na+/proline symporter n=1 Tax=Caballeronia sordidicola TaxID=196367 RepID=A0A226WM45_CABSO|nr:hypothetical protein [Caballeronia sordidicola]OXC72183.1 Na+/proline symporter [Caballeronia sordidicola]